MRRLVNHLAIASLIGLAIGAAVTVPAGASTGGAQFRIVGVHNVTSQVTQSKSQNSNIVGNTKKAIFSPNALTVLEDTSGGDCAESKPPVDFTITNTGSKTEYVTFRGSPNFSIKKGKSRRHLHLRRRSRWPSAVRVDEQEGHQDLRRNTYSHAF